MPWTNDQMAQRIAAEIQPGWIINLGIGIPTRAAGHIEAAGVMVHSENGILGMGRRPAPEDEDPDLVDAGKQPVTVVPGACFMDTLLSFSLIRGGHLDLAVMGGYQVSAAGDLANWRLPGRKVGGIGGAADLAAGARQVWVAMTHSSSKGEPKLVEECTYPLTARGVVSRVFTDLCVLEIDGDRRTVSDLAPGVTMADVRSATAFQVEAGSV
jgi:3-oxoacid CoA-transferase subunit B